MNIFPSISIIPIIPTSIITIVPYTKTLETKTESVNKYEPPDDNDNFGDMKAEHEAEGYEHEIIQEESQTMDEDEEDIVYEAYEIQEQLGSSSTASVQNQKSQIL